MKHLLMLTIILYATFAQAQTSFVQTIGTANNDYGYSVAPTFDGGYIITALYNNGESTLIKTDASGGIVWLKTYPFLTPNNPSWTNSSSIIQTSDSNYVWVGSLADKNAFILKLNLIGDTLWFKKSGYFLDWKRSYNKVVEDITGNLVIIGEDDSPNSMQCCGSILLKTDASGNILPNWNPITMCPSGIGCRFRELFLDSKENVMVSGDAFWDGGGLYPRLIKVNKAGEVFWDNYYLSVSNASVTGITQTPDNGYLLALRSSTGNDSTCILKTDSLGVFQWHKKYKAGSAGWQAGQIDTTSGGYLVSGYNGNIYLMKIGLDYTFQWIKEFGGGKDEYLLEMKSTQDNGCIMVGYTASFSAGNYDVYLIKTDEFGQAVNTTERSEKLTALFYPNPLSRQLPLSATRYLQNASIKILNCWGQTVTEMMNINDNRIDFSFMSLPNGVYFIN
jgi:hypothetical protein